MRGHSESPSGSVALLQEAGQRPVPDQALADRLRPGMSVVMQVDKSSGREPLSHAAKQTIH